MTKIFVALDTSDLTQAKHWATEIAPITGALKLGMEFVNAFGPQGIEAIQNAAPNADLFIDLKFHDIPNTVAGAVRTICTNFAPAYLNVHAAGGTDMMRAAKDACGNTTKLLAVTILTSLDHAAIKAVGYEGETIADTVKRLALLTQDAGLDGVVCSSKEIELVRQTCGSNFETMVPGIRPTGSNTNDQTRIMTPKEAITTGATNIVIGRPITQADNPAQTAQNILDSINYSRLG
ncbi:MAG: orotidine-5'-phosphate decarboxylase [Alphaproteobacteria bacterium]